MEGTSLRRHPPEAETVELRIGAETALARYFASVGATHGVIMVGGVGGGWDSPARELYPRLCAQFPKERIACLRIRYRYSSLLGEAVRDVAAGVHFMEQRGIRSHALIGHSFGGAVVLRVAETSPAIKAVIPLSTQSYGAGPVGRLGPSTHLLLIHGERDTVLPPVCSVQVHQQARCPSSLIVLPKAGHTLDESAAEVYERVHDFIATHLFDTLNP